MRILSLLLITLLIASCNTRHATALNENPEVRLTKTTPKGCKSLGKITGASKPSFLISSAPETFAIDDLKKNALEKGANVVKILKSDIKESVRSMMDSSGMVHSSIAADKVTYHANAYKCNF